LPRCHPNCAVMAAAVMVAMKGAEDNLADISQPAALEGNIISTLAGVMAASLSTFGTEKTLDLITEAIKAARRHSHE